jgi:putative selenate reductase molybdopterin-binding subunit
MECAIDELAKLLGIEPIAMRRKNVVKPGDNIESIWKEPSDASFGSYGITECLDIVERELKKGNGVVKPQGAEWAEGTGLALAMLECGPPTEHRSGAEMHLKPDGTYHLACGSTEMGNGITTAHKQMAAAVLGTRAGDVDIINADTDRTPYDTGTFASTGTVVGGKAVNEAAEAMRDDILDFAERHTGAPKDQCRLDNDAVICGNKRILLSELHAAGAKVNHRFTVSRRAYLSPRTIAFNVQGVRLAVHRVTGEIRILHSVHAADIGKAINPMQCRGQLDGAVSMGYGWALVENMVHDAEGHMVNPQLRNCRIPTFADTPHTDIFFADTIDSIGPQGAKSQGECGINPVAPAVSNALANATGVRFAHLPFTADRLYDKLSPRL